MKHIVQAFLASMFISMTVLPTTAQQALQPVVRLSDFVEVGNDVFIHIMSSADIRYKTVYNYDFENRVRDRVPDRNPSSTSAQEGDSDLAYAELRLGAELRYQKDLTLFLLFEHQQVFDGNTIDDRANCINPGGTDVFGRGAATETPGFHIERYWIDYKLPGTPLRMRVGADLWQQDQAGLVGDDDPRLALYFESGDFGALAAAVIQNESQRLGLENDNDFIYYTFSGWYALKPHKFQLDVTYFRDRFNGADTQAVGLRSGLGYTGQKIDSILLMASWSGTVGSVRGLLQGNLLVGTARGGTLGLPPGVMPGRDYDIFAGGVVAYIDADLRSARPFVGLVFGTGDGDPADGTLHGFGPSPQRDQTGILETSFFSHMTASPGFAALRDYTCPARAQGLTGTLGTAGRPVSAVGLSALGGSPGTGFAECAHSNDNPFNDRLGNTSHLGLSTSYSNPGTLLIPVGLRIFPLKGHELTGWYLYRGMVTTRLLEVAFAPELQGRSIGKTQYHEVGGFWQWTLNPSFDIRLAGIIGLPGEGYKDLGQLATCGTRACAGNDVALRGEARFRARF